MTTLRDDRGYTLVELLIVTFLLSIVAVGFYTVLLSGGRSSDLTQRVADISQEARLGFNRMVRDTREASSLVSHGASSFRIHVDFDGDGIAENPNENGDYEDLTFAYDATAQTITLNGEVLMAGIEPSGANDVFSYTSNRLEYDWNDDGVTTLAELEDASAHGVTLSATEIDSYLTSVNFALQVRKGNRVSAFAAEAQMRNNRT